MKEVKKNTECCYFKYILQDGVTCTLVFHAGKFHLPFIREKWQFFIQITYLYLVKSLLKNTFDNPLAPLGY